MLPLEVKRSVIALPWYEFVEHMVSCEIGINVICRNAAYREHRNVVTEVNN